jgi:hypothetical protein
MSQLFAVYRNDQIVTIEKNLRKAEREINKYVNNLDWEYLGADHQHLFACTKFNLAEGEESVTYSIQEISP